MKALEYYKRKEGVQAMTVTQIQIRKRFETGPLKAVVSVTFDNQLVVHDIKVVDRAGEPLLVMPNRYSEDKGYKDIVHPVNSDFRGAIEKQIFSYVFD